MSVSFTLVDGTPGAGPDVQQCRLSGALDFDTASGLLSSVTALIAEHPRLEIDLSGISKTNSAGLALMIEWLAQARKSGHVVTFSHIPDSLRQLAVVCEVDRLI
ncbi:MAG: lipid asymmetry maintenance protein MlaB [Granulosicoccus sp.]